MDWFTLVKFLHIVAAIVWIGGAFVMIMLGIRAMRTNDDMGIVAVVRQVAWAADRIFVPGSIATLVFGLVLAWLGSLWSELWVILGLVGIAITVGMGIFILTPMVKAIEKGFQESGAAGHVVAECRKVLTLARFDLVLLFSIIADMVLKPTASDVTVLAVLAVAVGGAALLWVPPALRKTAPA